MLVGSVHPSSTTLFSLSLLWPVTTILGRFQKGTRPSQLRERGCWQRSLFARDPDRKARRRAKRPLVSQGLLRLVSRVVPGEFECEVREKTV